MKPICPNCKTTAKIRYRVTTNTYICDKCGHTWPKEKKAEGGS